MQIRIRREEEQDFEIVNGMLPRLMEYSQVLDSIYKTSEEIKGHELLQIPINTQLLSKRENLIMRAKILNKDNMLLKEAEEVLRTTKLTNELMMNMFKGHVTLLIPMVFKLLKRDFDITID